MSSIGQLIRQERIKQNIKQSKLAEGICSASHLSKIENNTAIPSEEVVNLLFERLNLQLKEVTSEEEESIIESLMEIYKDAVLDRNHEQIREYLLQFSGQKINFKNLSNFYTYNLLMCRLFLVLREQDVTPFIETLMLVQDQFDNRQKFIFNLNLGIYYYSSFEFRKSIEILERSFEFMNNTLLEEWERADFYNFIGTTYVKTEEYFRSILYLTKALNYFRDHLYLKRAIDCYIILGISYKNTKQLGKAKDSYLLAKKLTSELGYYHYEAMLYHNLGRLYSMEGNIQKSIEYFHLSLQSKHQMIEKEGKLVTILALIMEYSKLNNSIQVNKWCQRGLNILDKDYQDDHTALPVSYRHHYLIYQAMHSRSSEFEEIVKAAITHFEEIRDYKYIHKYAILLVDHYVENKEYEKAAELFMKGEKAIFKQRNIKYWEDL